MAPGKGGLTYSPPLDAAGNSVRGQPATGLSETLGLNLFASEALFESEPR